MEELIMSDYKLKTGKVGEKVVGAYKKIEESFTDAFLEKSDEAESGYTLKTGKVGEKVVGGYKAIEDAVVGSYKKIEDKFVDTFLEEVQDESTDPVSGGSIQTTRSIPKSAQDSSKNSLEFSREIADKYTPPANK